MAIEFNDNIHVKINRPTDFRFGPFESIAQANSLIPIAQRYHGLLFGVYTNPFNIANSDIDYFYYWNGLTDDDVLPLSGRPPIDGSYPDEVAMIADQANQIPQYIYYDGSYYWEYLGTTNEEIDDYRRISNPPILDSYSSESSMISNQSDQIGDYIYYDGTSYWHYLGTTNGDITDYRQINPPVYGIDGIVNHEGSNELTLGGFIIEPTTEFIAFTDVPESVQLAVNNTSTYVIPNVFAPRPNAALYNMKTVLTDKVLFACGGVAIIFNADGTIYKYDDKPWIYLGEIFLGQPTLRNTIVTDTDVYMIGNFGSTFSTYDSSWTSTAVSGKVTAIKIDLVTGLVDPAFTFSTNNTYNGTPTLYRCILINNNQDMYVDSSMFSYDGNPNGYYMHVLDAATGAFKYGRTLPVTPGSIDTCIDGIGCGQRWGGIHAVAEDSSGRLYLSHPLSVYVTTGPVRGIIRVFPNPTTKFEVDTTFSINFTSYTTYAGYNVLIPLDDNSIIVATNYSSTASTTQIDGQPTKAIMKFDELANRDLNFGIGTNGKKGIYSHTNLESFNYIREDRPGVFRLYSANELIYNNGVVTVYVNYLFFDKDGLIIEDYEGFMLRSSNLQGRIYSNEYSIDGEIHMMLNPNKDTAVFHTIGFIRSRLANLFQYTNKSKRSIGILSSFSYYELITKQYNLLFYPYNQTLPPSVDKNISLGYTFDNNIKMTDESFITKSYLYRKFITEISGWNPSVRQRLEHTDSGDLEWVDV